MKAYVINLDSATDRLAKVREEIGKAGLNFKRIRGTLGKSLIQDERLEYASKACADRCPHAVLGVSISHIRTWKTALDDNVSSALICEDDVEFVDNFRSKLQEAVNQAPTQWDIIWAGCLFCEDVSIVGDLSLSLMNLRGKSKNISEKLWIPPYALGTHCYLVSRRGLHKLLRLSKNLNESIDIHMNRLLKKGELNGYALKSPIASQKNLANHSSISDQFPSKANKFLDNYYLAKNVGLGYGLSFPLWRHGNLNVNGWTAIFFLAGFLTSLWPPFSVFLGVCILDFSNHKEAVCASIVYFVIGFAFAQTLRHIKSINK